MALRRRDTALNPWPGYVDALSTLLMVIIFVLLVFVLAQAFLSVALNGRDRALDRLNRQMAEMTDMLSLERGKTTDLQASVAQLTEDLRRSDKTRADLATELATLQTEAAKTTADRDRLATQDQTLSAQLSDLQGLQKSTAAHATDLGNKLADAASRADNPAQAGKLVDQIRALAALRDALQAKLAATAGKLADATKLSDSEQAQIALLSQQMTALRSQLASVAAALDLQAKAGRDKDTQIANLGVKLNVALASRVAELQRYRSEFFGRLSAVLAGRPGIAVVGDRFVFQSEVLFPAGSADLTHAGTEQIDQLAATLKTIAAKIPGDLNWVLRVDGHADRQPLKPGGPFASNWELSSQRAIDVARRLIADGVSPAHLAATGFSDYQPLDPADTQAAYAKNRRIELRLTDR